MSMQLAFEILRLLLAQNASAVALVGPSAIGKTKMVEQAATSLGLSYRRVNVSTHEVDDLAGLPYRSGQQTFWAQPSWFPAGGDGVLNLDDVNRAPDHAVLNAVMPLFRERRLHEHTLPGGWRVVATLNAGQEYSVLQLDMAQISRLAVICVDAHLPSFIEYGRANGVQTLILDFLTANPAFFYVPPAPDNGCHPWPNPRAWEAASLHLPKDPVRWLALEPAILQGLMGTFVGEAAAAAFAEYLRRPFPSCKEIVERSLDRQAQHRLQTEPGLGAQRLRELMEFLPKIGLRRSHLENLIDFLRLIPRDAAVAFCQAMEREYPQHAWVRNLKQWREQMCKRRG